MRIKIRLPPFAGPAWTGYRPTISNDEEHVVVCGLCAHAVAETRKGSQANKLSSAAAAASLRRRDSSRGVPLLCPPDAGPRARRVVAAPPRRGIRAHHGVAAPPFAGRRPVPRQGLDPLSSSLPPRVLGAPSPGSPRRWWRWAESARRLGRVLGFTSGFVTWDSGWPVAATV